MKDLFDSKKFKAALVAAVLAFIASLFDMETEQVLAIISPFLGFIGAQGLADIGKSRAQVEAGDKPQP